MRAPRLVRSEHGAEEPPALDQDRRLRRGLRLLQPVRAPQNRPQSLEADGGRARPRRSQEGQGRQGATRYCMGAAWRSPKARDMDTLVRHGRRRQGARHGNVHDARHAVGRRRRQTEATPVSTTTITTSIRPSATTARSSPRAPSPTGCDTLARVREAGIKVCSGGIVGMGEEPDDRVDMLVTLANLEAASRKRADQHADRHSGHAARRCRDDRSDRFRAHHRARPHHDAEVVSCASRPAAPR